MQLLITTWKPSPTPPIPCTRQTPSARNRLLFRATEPYLHDSNSHIRLPLNDPRAIHIQETIRPSVGDTLRIGIVNGPPGTAVVRRLDQGCVELHVTSWEQPLPSARIRLLLALPRPKATKRLLPILPTLGIDQVLLMGAARVERTYWAGTLLSDPAAVETLLLEGMEQAADTRMPSVVRTKSLRAALALVSGATPPQQLRGFASCTHAALDEQLLQHVPRPEGELWVVAHPGGQALLSPAELAAQLPGGGEWLPRLNIVIGPEGGWQTQELEWLTEACGPGVSLGARVMTSTTAVIATTAAASAMRALMLQ